MRKLRIIDTADEFPSIRDLWEEVFASSFKTERTSTGWKAPRLAAPGRLCAATIFQTYAWNEIAARVFAERERPYVVVVESDRGAAIVPACVRRESLSLLGEELFDYRDVMAVGDESLVELGWQTIAELGLPLQAKAVRGERGWAEMKPFAGAPWLPCSVSMEKHYKLEKNLRVLAERGCVLSQGLKPSPVNEAYHPAEAGCPRSSATVNASAEERRSDVDEIGVLRSAQDDSSELLGLVRRMYQLKAQSESGSLFRDPLRIEAVVQMAASAPTEVFTIELEEELVAAILTFIDGDVCRFYGTYYDERWAKFSPGVSLLYRVIQWAQEHGLDFDFMTGEQAYKKRFASEVVPLYIGQVAVAARIAA